MECIVLLVSMLWYALGGVFWKASVHRRGSGGGRKQADTDGSGALDAEELSGVVTKLQLYMTAEDWVGIQRLEYAVFSDGVFKMSMSTRLHA